MSYLFAGALIAIFFVAKILEKIKELRNSVKSIEKRLDQIESNEVTASLKIRGLD